jgi:VCBS repeat-containing protein
VAQETDQEQETPETPEEATDPNAQTQTPTPAAGAPVIIVVNPGDVIPIAIASLAEANLSQDPNDPGSLVIDLPDGTQIVLQGFFAMAATGLPPSLSLADGAVIPAADVISAVPDLDPSAIATAAGGGTGGGAEFDPFDGGDIADGLGTNELLGGDDPGIAVPEPDPDSLPGEEANVPPDAVDDAFSTNEDTAFNGVVTLNDTDPEGDTLTTSLVSGTANGALVFNADGTFAYTPNPDFNGADSFTYQVTDSAGDTDTATVNITVNPVPDIAPDAFETREDTAVGGNVLDNDSYAGPVTVSAFSQPANGTVTVGADGAFNYTPSENFNGGDSFTYTTTDVNGATETTTVSITVTPEPDPVDDSDQDLEGTEDAGTVNGNIFDNDFDTGDGNVMVTAVEGGVFDPDAGTDGLFVVETNLGGQLTVDPDGNFVYTPPPQVQHTQPESDDSIIDEVVTVSFTDGDGEVFTQDVTLGVIDTEPEAFDDTDSTDEDTPITVDVLANDELGADPVTITSVAMAAGHELDGNVVIDGDQITFTPAPGFEDETLIDYTITDSDGDPSSAQVTITVGPDSEPSVEAGGAAVDETGGLDSVDGVLEFGFGNDTGTLSLSAAGATWDSNTNTLTGAIGEWQIVVNDGLNTYTVTQLKAMTHPDDADPNDAIVVAVTADAVDNEGDAAQAAFNVTFFDDGPSIEQADAELATVMVDETNLAANDSANFAGAFSSSLW